MNELTQGYCDDCPNGGGAEKNIDGEPQIADEFSKWPKTQKLLGHRKGQHQKTEQQVTHGQVT